MNDTLKEAEEFQNDLYKKFSGEEKMQMASNMFDTAREIIISSLPKGLLRKEIIKTLILRLYEEDFSEEKLADILKRINNTNV